jgi:hypothetical protein
MELRMRRSSSIVPQSDERDVYLVMDDFRKLGRAWCETDEERTDRETVIADLMDGQYRQPVRVISFNTAEGWSRDVTEEIAESVTEDCARSGQDMPAALESFVDQYRMPWPEQLALPLRLLA